MKVLIISHNPLTSYESMGKTLSTLFSTFSSGELCQLYIYPTLPDLNLCNSYYQITDVDVLKSFYRLRANGRVVFPIKNQHSLYRSKKEEHIYSNKKNQGSFRLLLRDYMWLFAHWYTKSLEKWIIDEKPDCIFVAVGLSKLIYRIALKISKKFGLKIISYICDDYFFSKPPKGITSAIHYHGLRKQIQSIIKKSESVIFICEKLTRTYSSHFQINGTTIMTGYDNNISPNVIIEDVKTIRFFGNIRLGRYESIIEVGEVLDEINETRNDNVILEVYSPENDEVILKKLKSCKSIKFLGFVSGDDFRHLYDSTNCFLHCESFDNKYIQQTRFSVSTKIPDILASGKIFISYGPSCIASMEYLRDNSAAIVCDDKKSLKKSLTQLIDNPKHATCFVKNALYVAKNNHNKTKNSTLLYGICCEVIENKKGLKR